MSKMFLNVTFLNILQYFTWVHYLLLFYFFQFAEWCLDYGSRKCPRADRPYSLFEGLFYCLYSLIVVKDVFSSVLK